jgi:hypothetical protein
VVIDVVNGLVIDVEVGIIVIVVIGAVWSGDVGVGVPPVPPPAATMGALRSKTHDWNAIASYVEAAVDHT